MRIGKTILIGVMIILSVVILILSLITISEIAPLSSDYMLAQAAGEITLESNPFSKVGWLFGWGIILCSYSILPSFALAKRKAKKGWLCLFWTPGIFVFGLVIFSIGGRYINLYSRIIRGYNSSHNVIIGNKNVYVEEVDPTPYINKLLPLIKSAVPSLVAICVLICICMFIIIFTGLISIATPPKSISNPKKRYSHRAKPISNQQVADRSLTTGDSFKFCTQCGKKLELDAKFCPECGVKTDD